MRLRGPLTTALALTLAGLTASPSLAATTGLPIAKPLAWTDIAGDANGVNSQNGLLDGVPDTATPASIKSDDITGVSFARTDDGKIVTGLQVTMTLSAAPAAGALYRITGAATGCTTFWFQYTWTAGGSPVATLRHNCGVPVTTTGAVGGSTVTVPVPAAVVGNSIVWTLKLTDLPSGLVVGSVLSPNLAEVRAVVGAAGVSLITAPTIDQTEAQTKTYTIGQ